MEAIMKQLPAYLAGRRRRTRDAMLTYDMAKVSHDGAHNAMGASLGGTFKSRDGTRTYDSTGAFLIGELEVLDRTLHDPLMMVSYGRDLDIRQDATVADDVSSFTLSNFGSAGSLGTGNGIGNGKAWIGKVTSQVSSVSVDLAKKPQPLRLWGLEVSWSIPELMAAARLGRSLDSEKTDVLKKKHQMDTDEQAYFGDTTTFDTGLVNSTFVTNVSNVANGAGGSPLWSQKTPDEILADFNAALTSVWTTSAWAQQPKRVLLPTTPFGFIATEKVSEAGNISILNYVKKNNVMTAETGEELQILPAKWCNGAGAGGTIGVENGHDRMVVYTKQKDYVRFPLTALSRTPLQFDGLWQKTVYYGRIGILEVVYPETIGYFDGIG